MKKLLFLVIFGINFIISYSLNFSVVPTRFEIELNKVNTDEIYIINNTTESMRLEAYIEGDKDFGIDFNLNSDIIIFPKKIFIKPGERQIVRFRVKPNSKYSDGEYKSYIVFKEVPYDMKSTDNITKNLTNVNIITEIGIPVYGIKGNSSVENKIEKLNVKRSNKNIFVRLNVNNLGNTSSKFSYEIISKKLKENLKGKLGMSSRKGKSSITTEIPIPENLINEKFKLLIKDQNQKIYFNDFI